MWEGPTSVAVRRTRAELGLPPPNTKWKDKTCTKCSEPVCAKGLCRRHYENQRRRWGSRHLRAYGLTEEMVNEMRERQGNACAVCKQPFGPRYPKTHDSEVVDHCHRTGKVRGLLHSRCNIALGHALESTEILGNMIAYLQEHL